jgi:hypothetical protein
VDRSATIRVRQREIRRAKLLDVMVGGTYGGNRSHKETSLGFRRRSNAERRDMRCWITPSRSQLYANIEAPHQANVCIVLYSWRTTASPLIAKWNLRVTKNLAVLGILLAPICTCFVVLGAVSEG